MSIEVVTVWQTNWTIECLLLYLSKC